MGKVMGPVTYNECINIICDICNTSCKKYSNITTYTESLCEFAEFSADWGYQSSRDSERWSCYMCEGCAEKIKIFIESLGGKVIIK